MFQSRGLPDHSDRAAAVAEVLGLGAIWAETRGNPGICVAVLDGPVDFSHPCLAGARLTPIETLVPSSANSGPACRHGTHIASIIFGQPGSPIEGIAPACSGVIAPVFASGPQNALIMCSQIDLARAILQAVEHGAHVINISGGQLSATGDPEPLLEKAIRTCAERNVLVVAAAGNDGCDCLHIPAALDTVLSVGAMDAGGAPLDISNWGHVYQTQGILAPGQNILGATPGGDVGLKSGTSFATAITTGVAALLLSVQLKRGERPDPHAVRLALIRSAASCNLTEADDNRRCLAGRLNPRGALNLITEGGIDMSDTTLVNPNQEPIGISASELPGAEQATTDSGTAARNKMSAPTVAPIAGVMAAEANSPPPPDAAPSASPPRIAPSDCGCGGGANCTCGGQKAPQLVYALGTLGYDFGTEARRDFSPRE